jgi:hypothetical protein
MIKMTTKMLLGENKRGFSHAASFAIGIFYFVSVVSMTERGYNSI